MANQETVNGQCLCGAVKMESDTVSNKVHACHCDMCRRWSGGPLLAVDCEAQVKFDGESNISRFDSSDWAERGFCAKCGTHLFYRLKQSGQYIVPVGLFSNLEGIEFEGQIFTDQKPHYYEFANETEMMTAEQVFAMFAESTPKD